MTTATVDRLVEQFEALIGTHEKKTVATFIEDFRQVVGDYLKEAARKAATTKTPTTKTTSTKRAPKEEGEKKLDSWPRIWVSKKYGGRTSFPEDYERIKDEAEEEGNKLTSFQILSQLRTLLEGEEGQKRWKEWYERVQQENDDAPRDPPSERQPKKETKKKPSPKGEPKKEVKKEGPKPASPPPATDDADEQEDDDADVF
jgi:hypothetical protein